MARRSPERSAVAAGVVLDGKYRIEGKLGHGGMGFVVAAWHLDLDERVALKFLHAETLDDPAVVERFSREARAAAKIKGEHVCRVLDVGRSDAYGPFLVMEYLSGEDLGKRIRRTGPLPVSEAVGYVLHACLALAEAHARGIVHRDLKPANLFLTQRPDGKPLVKVLDFGISKMTHQGAGATPSPELTTASVFLGSYAYMAPEQLRNARDVDARADIWALGVILHKLVSGAMPFDAESPSEWIAKIVADPPARIREARADLPVEFERVVLGCLEKQRERRFATVADLAAALRPFAPGSEGIVASIARVIHSSAAGTAEPEAARPLEIPASREAKARRPVVGGVPDDDAAPTEAFDSHSGARASAGSRAASAAIAASDRAVGHEAAASPAGSHSDSKPLAMAAKTQPLPARAESGVGHPLVAAAAIEAPPPPSPTDSVQDRSPQLVTSAADFAPDFAGGATALVPVGGLAPADDGSAGSVSTMTPWTPSQAALLEGRRPRAPFKALLAVSVVGIVGALGLVVWLVASSSSGDASAGATEVPPTGATTGIERDTDSSRAPVEQASPTSEPPRTTGAAAAPGATTTSNATPPTASASAAAKPTAATARPTGAKGSSTAAKAPSSGRPPKGADPFGHL